MIVRDQKSSLDTECEDFIIDKRIHMSVHT